MGIAAISLYPLVVRGDALSQCANLFFGWSVVEQMSLLALLFATVAAVVSLASPSDASKRQSSHRHRNYKPPEYPLQQISTLRTEQEQFKALYPLLRDEILILLQEEHELAPETIERVATMMDYTVRGGSRGTTVVSILCKTMSQKGGKSAPSIELLVLCKACVLGWAVEFLQAFLLVADDVMDESQTRRGQPCWYKKDHVRLIAINDSFLLESFVFFILRQHFGTEPYYLELVELFRMVIQKTEIGQLLDLTSQPLDQPKDLNRFTLERYRQIVKYKTSYYTFYLPVAIGMITSGIIISTNSNHTDDAFETAERICCIMGEYFQIQDDYLDCYGKPDVIGKMGTDIQDNKCSWLVVQALERATTEQRQVLIQNYGKWDDKKVARVKDLYDEMGLQQVFCEYEESSYKEIQAELDRSTVLPRAVFDLLLKNIYRRSK
jgi:farnesyl diphosphate synthase